jgi:hypothetical protein
MEPTVQTARPQRRLLLGGKIIFNNKSSVFDCMIRALSADGGELRLKSTLGVPDLFQLKIDTTGDTFTCDVLWRTETDIGVSFLKTPTHRSSLMKNVAEHE